MMIDKQHAEVWKAFYKKFTLEETKTLYRILKKRIIPKNKIIYSQGSFNAGLYFIDSGRVSSFFTQDKKNHLLTNYDSGHLIGTRAFFNLTNCTESVMAIEDTHLHHLSSEGFQALEEVDQPIAAKLSNICMKFKNHDLTMLPSTLNRRKDKRYKVNGRAMINIMTKFNTNSKVNIIGDLSDLSQGGAAVQIKIDSRKKARALLGRNISVHAKVTDIGIREDIQKTGKILSITDLFFNNYSVCIMFNSVVNKLLISEFPGASYEF